MKTKIIKTAVVVLLIFSFTLGGCWIVCTPFVPPGFTRIYTDNNYTSAYTPEQHIERISEIFEEYYNENYSEILELIGYDIYTVYSFDDKPEFFLMEFIWGNKSYANITEPFYSHLVGIIYHDQYYLATKGLSFGFGVGHSGYNGKSIYSQLGVLGSGKKLLYSVADVYSEGLFAYVDDGKVMGTEIEKYEEDKLVDNMWNVNITYKELREIKPTEFKKFVKREPFNAEKFCYID